MILVRILILFNVILKVDDEIEVRGIKLIENLNIYVG